MRPRDTFASLLVAALSLVVAAGCDSGIDTGGTPAARVSSAPVVAASPSPAAKPAPSGSPKGRGVVFVAAPGSEKALKDAGIAVTSNGVTVTPQAPSAPTEATAIPGSQGKPLLLTRPAGMPTPRPPKNTSAMPDPSVDYVRFVRTLEEDRQLKMVARQNALNPPGGAAAPDDAKSADLLRTAAQEAKARLARLRARTAPEDCRTFAKAYEAALIEDAAEAEEDAALVAKALAADKAGDRATRDSVLAPFSDPARRQERARKRTGAFGRADAAFVGVLRQYPSSPPDFASIRFGDDPF
jgi:hypothetical protein